MNCWVNGTVIHTGENMKATMEQNRKQKDFLDKLEARMGLYVRKRNKAESGDLFSSKHGFKESSIQDGAASANSPISMQEKNKIKFPVYRPFI